MRFDSGELKRSLKPINRYGQMSAAQITRKTSFLLTAVAACATGESLAISLLLLLSAQSN
jgi:hypothetical protein